MKNLNRQKIIKAITCKLAAQGPELNELYSKANRLRQRCMGDTVYLRGIIEFSSCCANDCCYCGLRSSNSKARRYSMSGAEILATALELEKSSLTTVVLQAGESPHGDEKLGEIIRQIKQKTNLAVTLSVGNRSRAVYQYWKDCGMDRYLLRYATSDKNLFKQLNPDCSLEERLDCLHMLRELGVQVGSGFMIGLPGEKPTTVAENILLCRALKLDMIGIGPFIPHPDTPLGNSQNIYSDDPEVFYKTLALLRIFNPWAHIPATTAYDAIAPGIGRNLTLQRGANVFMPNNTPMRYRDAYLLYPGKPCVDETPQDCAACVVSRIAALGRKIGTDPGHSIHPHFLSGTAMPSESPNKQEKIQPRGDAK